MGYPILKRQILTISLCCIVFHAAIAGEFQSAIDDSKVIAEIVIASSTNRYQSEIDAGCGFAYQGSIKRSLTNDRVGSRISFRSDKPLKIATAYLAFLTDETSNSDDTARVVDIRSTKCLESGISFTVANLPTGGLPFGRELIFEHRYLSRDIGGQRVAGYYYVLEGPNGALVSAAVNNFAPLYVPTDEVVSDPPRNRANTAYEVSRFLEIVERQMKTSREPQN